MNRPDIRVVDAGSSSLHLTVMDDDGALRPRHTSPNAPAMSVTGHRVVPLRATVPTKTSSEHTGPTDDEVQQGSDPVWLQRPVSRRRDVSRHRRGAVPRRIRRSVRRGPDREAAKRGLLSLAEREKRALYLPFFEGKTQCATRQSTPPSAR